MQQQQLGLAVPQSGLTSSPRSSFREQLLCLQMAGACCGSWHVLACCRWIQAHACACCGSWHVLVHPGSDRSLALWGLLQKLLHPPSHRDARCVWACGRGYTLARHEGPYSCDLKPVACTLLKSRLPNCPAELLPPRFMNVTVISARSGRHPTHMHTTEYDLV